MTENPKLDEKKCSGQQRVKKRNVLSTPFGRRLVLITIILVLLLRRTPVNMTGPNLPSQISRPRNIPKIGRNSRDLTVDVVIYGHTSCIFCFCLGTHGISRHNWVFMVVSFGPDYLIIMYLRSTTKDQS